MTLSAGGWVLNGTSASILNNSLTWSGGTLSGGGNLTVTGPIAWTGGTKSGGGTLTANGGLTISGTGGKTVSGGEIDNAANAVLNGNGTIELYGGGTISNLAGATFDDQVDVTVKGVDGCSSLNGCPSNGVFNNAGIFTKSGGTGTTAFARNIGSGVQVAFNNSGTLNVNSGTLNLQVGTSSGAVTVASGVTLTFGECCAGSLYTFPSGASLSGGGNVVFSGDTTSFDVGTTYNIGGNTTVAGGGVWLYGATSTGTYTQTGGTLVINLGGSTSCSAFGQVNVGGAVTLGGALKVALNNGCSPTATQSFQVMTYASHSGTFASTSTPTVNGQPMAVNYYATNVTVGAGNQPPTVSAGGPYYGTEGAPIALSGATASDSDGDTLAYAWSGPAGCTFSNASSLNPTVTCAASGSYNLQLSVSDGPNAVRSSTAVNVGISRRPWFPGLAVPIRGRCHHRRPVSGDAGSGGDAGRAAAESDNLGGDA